MSPGANVRYIVPGHHQLAGQFAGVEEIARHFNRLIEVVHGTLDVLKWEDRMVGLNYVSVVGRLTLQLGGRIATEHTIFVFAFEPENRIGTNELFLADLERATALST